MSDVTPGHWLVDTALIAAVDSAIETGDEQRARALTSNPTVLICAVEVPAGGELWERDRAEAVNRDLHERFGARFPGLVQEWRRRWSARKQAVASAAWGLGGLALGLLAAPVAWAWWGWVRERW